MSKRLVCLTLLAVVIAGSSGCNCICCLHDNLLGLWKSRRWADCGCGPVYYGPWFDTKPACCDPCNDCGEFHGKRYWTSANSWLSDSQQSVNPWQNGNPRPGNPGMQNGAPMMNDPMMDAPMMGAPMMDDSMDGMPYQGEPVGPGNQVPTPAAPQLNQPQPGPGPSSPSPRMGRRQRGVAVRTPNPYDSNLVSPTAAFYDD